MFGVVFDNWGLDPSGPILHLSLICLPTKVALPPTPKPYRTFKMRVFVSLVYITEVQRVNRDSYNCREIVCNIDTVTKYRGIAVIRTTHNTTWHISTEKLDRLITLLCGSCDSSSRSHAANAVINLPTSASRSRPIIGRCVRFVGGRYIIIRQMSLASVSISAVHRVESECLAVVR